MANGYVRSTDGSDADNGSTWALADATITGFAAADVAGDFCFLSQVHAESITAANATWALAGTVAAPTRVICVNDAAEPPTSVANTATITSTGNFFVTATGSFYMRGISFFIGTGSGSPGLIFQNGAHQYEDMSFQILATGNAYVKFGDGTRTDLQKDHLKNCNFKFASATNRIALESDFRWEGGSVLSGSSTPARLFYPIPRQGVEASISGVDFSVLASTFSFFDSTITCAFRPVIRNCKLPAGWPSSTNGLFNAAPTQPGVRAEMHNSDGIDTNHRLRIEDHAGIITSETVVVRTGGATDGSVPFSWKMVTNANANALTAPLDSPELPAVWNSVAGSPITVKVDILSDGATNLKDDEIALHLQYLGTSGFPVSTFISDARANVLATAADQSSSASAWTTTGLTTPNMQELSVTFTPQEAGFIQGRVVHTKVSKAVYVDPKFQVS